jgi:N-acetyl-gamma-glutamyl-phosphate reductase
MGKQKVGIVGYRGYSGAEAVRILSRHAFIEPVLLEHRADAEHRAEPIRSSLPSKIACSAEAAVEYGLTAVLLATPADVSMSLTRDFLQAGLKVVDLSGAFRFRSSEMFTNWYKEPHHAPEWIAEAVYGLPEFYREDIAGKKLVGESGLLSDGCESGDSPACRRRSGKKRSGNHLRCQERSQRRGTKAPRLRPVSAK